MQQIERRAGIPAEFSLGQVATMLGVSYDAVKHRVRRGSLPATRRSERGHFRVSFQTLSELYPDELPSMLAIYLQEYG